MKSLWGKSDSTGASSWLNRVADDAALKLRQQKEALLQKAQLPAGLAAVEVREKTAGGGEAGSGNAAAGDSRGGEVPTVKEPPKKEQQYLRLPVESAKKLRFYDKADLEALIRVQSEEKAELYNTINALRQILENRLPDLSWLDAEVEALLAGKACLNAYDDGVNATLLVAAQAELERLRGTVVALRGELSDMAEANAALIAKEEKRETAQASAAPLRQAADSSAVRPQATVASAPLLRERTEVRLLVEKGWGEDEEETVIVELLAEGTAVEEEALDNSELLLEDNHRSTQELRLRVTELEVALREEKDASSKMLDKMARLEEELTEKLGCRSGVNGPSSELENVEALRKELLGAQSAAARGQEEIRSLRGQLRAQEEESEQKLGELRSKVSQAAQQQSDMLRRAQDICLEAEERAENAEQKTAKAEARATRFEAEMRELKGRIRDLEKENKRLEKEREKAEARAEHAASLSSEAAMKGHAEAQAGSTVRAQMAAIRRSAEEREAELRRALSAANAAAEEASHRASERAAELEEEAAGLTAALSRAQAESDTWERRLREAEEREAALLSDLREAEAVAAERDVLRVRVTALEDKLNESRSERTQIDHYKQVARELEAARGRAEEELMATARIVTGLESRLRSSNREVEASRLAMEAAEKRCLEVERRVEEEVRTRIKAAGADRSRWPPEAVTEIGRLEAKVDAVSAMASTLEEQLAVESKSRAGDARHAALLRQRVNELEGSAIRNEREAADRMRVLERDLRAARDEAEECRRIVSEVEEEREALRQQMQPEKVVDEQGMFRNRGGGSLYGASDEVMAAAGRANGGAPRPEMVGVDIVYLKNVVLKFIEAAVREDAAQRDALLPAIATLVQATPQEFKALQAVVSDASSDNSSWYSIFGSGSK